MNKRDFFTPILAACLLAVGLTGNPSMADAASAGQSFLAPSQSARSNAVEIDYRGRGRRVHLPIGPSRIYYDYPYYYSRGYYPTHIGPRYVYDYPFAYGGEYYPRHESRCSYSHRRCAANRGYRNDDY